MAQLFPSFQGNSTEAKNKGILYGKYFSLVGCLSTFHRC